MLCGLVLPLLVLSHDTPLDARFVRGYFNVYYRAALFTALGDTEQALGQITAADARAVALERHGVAVLVPRRPRLVEMPSASMRTTASKSLRSRLR